MKAPFFAIMLATTQFAVAQESIDITPQNAKEHGVIVRKVSYGSGYKVHIEFPPSKDGMEGFAVINVAYAEQETNQLRTVQIPQYKGLALITGDAVGLRQSFVVTSYSNSSDINQILSVHLGGWLNE